MPKIQQIAQVNYQMLFLEVTVHVFFKKHKFKKHEAQNTEILRNI